MLRLNKRPLDALRQVEIQIGYTKHAEGSVLICMGDTKVLCTATVEESLPSFKKGSGEGWITAEYSMLPRATVVRNPRDIARLKQNPRSVEIQRLIGRSLRAAVDLKKLGERSITIDCDVIQADGGTRTASITGGFVALAVAVNALINKGSLSVSPIVRPVAAISVGIVNGSVLLDLCYEEDFAAEVDMNVVMADYDEFVEIQGTGEKGTFDMVKLNQMLEIAKKGNRELMDLQRQALQYDWMNSLYNKFEQR